MAQHSENDPLAKLFVAGVAFMTDLLPGWEPPSLLPPGAMPFDDSHELRDRLRVGDHVAVMTTSGYWHHGVFVGMQPDTGATMVVEVWGETKFEARVTCRTFGQFVAGGTRFALVNYPDGAALSNEHSAALALHLRAIAGPDGCYNVAYCNCEHFATMCRSLRWEQAHAVPRCIGTLSAHPAAPLGKRGFK